MAVSRRVSRLALLSGVGLGPTLLGLHLVGASTTNPLPMHCSDRVVRRVRLPSPIVLDGLTVDLGDTAAYADAGATVTVTAGRFERVLRAHGIGHTLRFQPGLRGDTFQVTLAYAPGSSCVSRIALLAGDEAVAVVEP